MAKKPFNHAQEFSNLSLLITFLRRDHFIAFVSAFLVLIMMAKNKQHNHYRVDFNGELAILSRSAIMSRSSRERKTI
jgi:hypothetical protein